MMTLAEARMLVDECMPSLEGIDVDKRESLHLYAALVVYIKNNDMTRGVELLSKVCAVCLKHVSEGDKQT